ncbi:hypothetical protein [Natronococcus jeotgali]|uniref:Uncharacterized protein n=1 Tax=Natronococcus jeotgali DSM 18795 TaxID=1227498 RepID=L9WTW6_9EURY|nr:hypothetical protein [Natronococcus jeotgali]ELY52857.1 hypothetical protein C492_18780 [Natronococcus jeotgali DSM 18795]
MGLERFVRLHLVLIPALVLAGYLFADSLPVIVVPFGVAYITFTGLICFAWVFSRASMRLRSS